MIASLPMYDFTEIRHATDSLWRAMVRHLQREGVRNVPERLVHDRHLTDLWSDKNLFISQCCGYDIVHRHKDSLQVLATPCFGAPGCGNGRYASIVVVPENSPYGDVIDMMGTVVVINGPDSQSGMNALFALVGPYSRNGKFFSRVRISGSHVQTLATLKKGDADVAAVDCFSYELLRRYRPSAIDGTRPLGWTDDAPSPPYVTRTHMDTETVTRMKTALLATFNDPSLSDILETLLLTGIELSSVDTYQPILSHFSHGLRAV